MIKRAFFLAIFIIFITHFNVYAGKIIPYPAEGYYMVLPNLPTGYQELPVLICLPGWGVKAKNDVNIWAFHAAKRGFLVIDIDVDYSKINYYEDLKAFYERITNIINSISTDYNINKNKVYLAGTSGGGMLAIALALGFPDKFKAIGIICGARLYFGATRLLKNAKGQLFYFVHGQKDVAIPIAEFYDTKKHLEANGAIIEFKVLPEGFHTLPSGCYKETVDWFYQLSELSR